MTTSFVGGLALELKRAFDPLASALASTDGLRRLVHRFGWPVDTFSTEPSSATTDTSDDASNDDDLDPPFDESGLLSAVQKQFGLAPLFSNIEAAVEMLGSSNDESRAAGALIKAVGDLLGKLAGLTSLAANPPPLPFPLSEAAFWQEIPPLIIDELLAGYLEENWAHVYGTLVLFGIIELTQVAPPGDTRVPYLVRRIVWHRMANLFVNPRQVAKDVYHWDDGTVPFDAAKCIAALQIFFWSVGFPARRVAGSLPKLRVPLLTKGSPELPAFFEAGLAVEPIGDSSNPQGTPVGLAISPVLVGSVQEAQDPPAERDLGWSLSLSGEFSTDNAFAVALRPSGVAFQIGGSAALSGMLGIEGRANPPWVIAGAPGSHRLEANGFHAQLSVAGTTADPDFRVEIGTGSGATPGQLRFVLQFAEGDGFLKNIFGSEPRTVESALALCWSSRTGFSFVGSAGITLQIPIHYSLGGVIYVDTLTIGLGTSTTESGQRGVALTVAITANFHLGPLSASVDEVGAKLLAVPTSGTGKPGTFGNLDLQFGFKPPNGLGLSLSTEIVSGGGSIVFDLEKQQYSGVLRLNIKDIVDVKVIGILNARLPDGRPGYSLLLIITGEFPPIQLGLGFTLNGVGGLIGINRTAVVDVLRAGLRNGAMDSILFPPDPLNNVPALLSTLGSVFPVAEGRYVFGPMVKIAWGSPTILTLDLALILEIPDPVRLIVLGRLKAVLPDEKNPVVQIRMDAMGVLDFSRNELSLDATLYDSRILTFTITGDMALRLVWGARPNFILSVGGFHPHFEAPPGLTKLSRLAIVLVDREKDGVTARVRFESYLALTSNTVQFGARVDMYFKALGVEAVGFLSFDALIHFSPLTLEAQLAAAVALSFNGVMLMGADLAVTLTGPTPWHLFGEARFDFLGAKQRVPVEVKTGDDSAPPPLVQPVAVRDLLIKAIEDPRNWQAQPPDGADRIVALRIAEGDDQSKPRPLMVHPLGSLAVRQRVLPLTVPITRYGNAPVQGDSFFDVVVPLSGALVEPLQEQFAMSQYKVMRDDEKLAAASFEAKKAGVRFRDDKFVAASAVKQAPALEHATRTMVPATDGSLAASRAMELPVMRGRDRQDVSQMEHLIALGAAANAPTRAKGKSRYFAVASDGTGA